MFAELNGFYAGYMSGSAEQGLAVFIFCNGALVGADFAGTRFDGRVKSKSDDGSYECNVSVSLPPGGQTIQGVPTGPNGLDYNVTFTLPGDFSARPFFHVETPLGGVNVRLQKVRDLGGVSL